jgi:hypothetical protein
MVIPAGTDLVLEAAAGSTNQQVLVIEFFGDEQKLGESSTTPAQAGWPNVSAGVHSLWAVAHFTGGLSRTSAIAYLTASASVKSEDLALAGTSWHFWDRGTHPGRGWTSPSFDDSGWSRGAAPLGYGEVGEVQPVNYGPDPAHKYITTYFRQSFLVADGGSFAELRLRLRGGYGAVVYLNDVEIARRQLPDGNVGNETLALPGAGAEDGATYFSVTNALGGLVVPGLNVLAVEAHLPSAEADRLSFDLSLAGQLVVHPPFLYREPRDQWASDGGLLTVKVAAGGTPPWACKWFLGQTNLVAQGMEPTLTLPGFRPDQAGQYSVVVTNAGGAVTSRVATVSLGIVPELSARLATNGSVIVSFLAVSNQPYALQYRDLVNWGSWWTLHEIRASPFNWWVDLADVPSATSQRYYRLITPPGP